MRGWNSVGHVGGDKPIGDGVLAVTGGQVGRNATEILQRTMKKVSYNRPTMDMGPCACGLPRTFSEKCAQQEGCRKDKLSKNSFPSGPSLAQEELW